MKQLEYLVGKDLEPVFAWFFRGHIPLCSLCGKDVPLCACEDFEHRELALESGAPVPPRPEIAASAVA
jgi:hypothetical protein